MCSLLSVPIMFAPCVALPVIFLSRISSNIIKYFSGISGMCVICVEFSFLAFNGCWKISFIHQFSRSVRFFFSGHKPIVWSMADCLINEPFLLRRSTQKNPFMPVFQWAVFREALRAGDAWNVKFQWNNNARRFIELIDVAFWKRSNWLKSNE